MKNTIQLKVEKYKQLNLEWNISSMLFINDSGFILEDLVSDNDTEALILIMTAGIKNKDSNKVKKFINMYYSTYKEIESIKCFVIYDLKNKHNFITNKHIDDTPLHPLLKEKEDTEISHSEKLRINRENYEYIIRVYLEAGYRIDEVMQMDLTNFDYINDYVIRKHEERLNDLMLVAHRTGMLAGIGFVNLKKYPDKPEVIRLRQKTKEEIIAQKEAEARVFQNSVCDDIVD